MTKSALDKRLEGIIKKNENEQNDNAKHYADREIKTTYYAVQFSTASASYGIEYQYLRPKVYDKNNDVITCSGDGFSFIVSGENMALLFDLICSHAVHRIEEGKRIEFGETVISVESVIVETLGDDE